MASGKVKWFDNRRGFGFILDETGKEIFVHHTCIAGAGFKTLKDGEPVSFEAIQSEKGFRAQNVQRHRPHR
jgi:CspA family cold shock protein